MEAEKTVLQAVEYEIREWMQENDVALTLPAYKRLLDLVRFARDDVRHAVREGWDG